ncbi:MAG TPA: dihydroneopterin aldolase [Methylomirabilota bacterium]|nr:dihydroneopterin aldolase [Methylomirabilota bacterium]
MDQITIADLEVYLHVGVTEEERANPQRLLITLDMALDVRPAAASDNLAHTIDYAAVAQRVMDFGTGCHWELIEALAGDLAEMVLDEFKPESVTVEVKKFVLPHARHVAVRLTRARRG